MVDHGGCIGRWVEQSEQLRGGKAVLDARLQVAGLQPCMCLAEHTTHETQVVEDLSHAPLGNLTSFSSQLLPEALNSRFHHAEVIVQPVITKVAGRQVMAFRQPADDRGVRLSRYEALFDLLPVRGPAVLQFATYRAG